MGSLLLASLSESLVSAGLLKVSHANTSKTVCSVPRTVSIRIFVLSRMRPLRQESEGNISESTIPLSRLIFGDVPIAKRRLDQGNGIATDALRKDAGKLKDRCKDDSAEKGAFHRNTVCDFRVL